MPIFDQPTLIRLLASIEANHLMVLCGAGLSLPAPSNLMSAMRVSQTCYDKWRPTEVLPQALRDDIDALAGHFHHLNQFKRVFIRALVPWDELVGEPNVGHAAIADMLICRAFHAALSGNFDPLIEQWSERRKIAMQGALDGAEAVEFSASTSPLVKFHGCLHRRRDETLWTQGQLGEPDIQLRIQNCSAWMTVNLPAKDLLVVGFWTDWGYLNDVLAQAITTQGIASITVIDPSSDADLAAKAPQLWAKLTGNGGPFVHIQASGADALDELRTEFSKVWARKFFALGAPFVQQQGGGFNAVAFDASYWTGEDLYDLRRDAEGVPYNRAARKKDPPVEAASAAFAHILLASINAPRNRSFYEHNGNSVRVVHGGGQTLETVRERYNEPPSVAQADIVVCAGADSLSVPGALVAAGQGASIVRPARGGASRWLTLEQARQELGI